MLTHSNENTMKKFTITLFTSDRKPSMHCYFVSRNARLLLASDVERVGTASPVHNPSDPVFAYNECDRFQSGERHRRDHIPVIPRTLHFASTARKLAGHLCREVSKRCEGISNAGHEAFF